MLMFCDRASENKILFTENTAQILVILEPDLDGRWRA
jgi:hypothetical protein